MAQESFDTNLLRMIAAQQWLSLALQASREFYGKSYTTLSVAEKAVLDQLVFGAMAANYQAITPAWLASQQAQAAVGFQVPASAPTGAQTTTPAAPDGRPKGAKR
ncbi:MAG: hypothetical protein KGJ13_05295 [Patescibacteria group bacterium]|nr:hypothetical protein [Patescibacteria group bacterium]